MIKNHIVVILFNIPWEWSTDYTNQTAYVLSKKNTTICYMRSEALSIKEYLQRGKLPKIIIRRSKNLYLFYPLYLIPFRRLKFVSALNSRLNIFLLKLFIRYFEITRHVKKKIVWFFYPNLATIAKSLGKDYLTIYDCVDFFAVGTYAERKQVERHQKQLLKYADLVVANSKVLQKYLRKWREDVRLVPQGFRLEHFEKYERTEEKYKIPKKLANKKPLIGFVGGVNNRLDFELLTTLCRKNPQWNFAVWGPLQKNPSQKNRFEKNLKTLLSLPNVISGVSKNKRELPAIINEFDIGIIPYDESQDFNKYCYPMKLFEYFYMRKPIVSTPIEELKRFPKYVKIGRTPKEWKLHIKNLLSNPWPKKYKLEQKKLAEENSWEKKVEKISEILKHKTLV